MARFSILDTTTTVGRERSVGMVTRYRLDGPGTECRWGARIFASVQTGPGAHPASYTIGIGSFWGQSSRDVALTTHIHLAPRLKEE